MTDVDTTARMYEAYAAPLKHWVIGHYGIAPADAEDVVQETFTRALSRSASPFNERSHAEIRGWLYTTARNILIDQARGSEQMRRGMRAPVDADHADYMHLICAAVLMVAPPGITPDEALLQNEAIQYIKQVLNSLPLYERYLLYRHAIKEETVRTIVADPLLHSETYRKLFGAPSVTWQSVRSRLYRARTALRRSLQELYPDASV